MIEATGLGGTAVDNGIRELLDDRAFKDYAALTKEQSGKLLKKRLRPWFASNRHADRLTFEDTFRHANKHCLIGTDACERWFGYRDNRNDTAHDYGEGFAEATLELLPDFLADAEALAVVIGETTHD